MFMKGSQSTFLFFVTLVIALVIFSAVPCRTAASKLADVPDQVLIPAALVSLASNYAVIVDKSAQKIYVFHRNDKGMELHFKTTCSTGINGGSKEIAGDGKTPEGIYFATDRYTERELTSTYGAMAYNLNYPNCIDHKKGRTGYNIWIHGTDADLNPFQSNGCIVLRDKDIRQLSRFIELNKTPIIILDRVQWVSEDILMMGRQELAPVLDQWISLLKEGRVAELQGIYERDELIDRASLNAIVDRMRKWKLDKVGASFDIHNVSMLKHERHAVITFDQTVDYRNRSWKCGHRVLFLDKADDNRWIISGDVLQEPASPELLEEQLKIIDALVDIFASVEEVIDRWRRSWQSGDMKEYASYYAPDFRGNGMNLKRWIAYKKSIADGNENISITIGELDITPGSRVAKVSFEQEYRSSKHSDVGIKTLHLKKINDRWKISREMWRAL